MQIKHQVTSLTISKELKKAGYPQVGYFRWYQFLDDAPFISHNVITWDKYIVAIAPTVAELGEKMPAGFKAIKGKNCWFACGEEEGFEHIDDELFKNEANSRAKMWIYLNSNT